MRIETKNPVLAGTGSVATFKACEPSVAEHYTHFAPEIHHRLRVDHLHHRFGLPARRAALIAGFAFGGGL